MDNVSNFWSNSSTSQALTPVIVREVSISAFNLVIVDHYGLMLCLTYFRTNFMLYILL